MVAIPAESLVFKWKWRWRRVLFPSTSTSHCRRSRLPLATTQQGLPLLSVSVSEADPISVVNHRIRRHHQGHRDSSRTVMDAEEADKYIQLVKEQQQRGLQKLKQRGPNNNNNYNNTHTHQQHQEEEEETFKFSYKVDPYSLRSGDYVVHKKVGVGRFVGIKLDLPKASAHPIEYVFIEYADGMAKLPLNQAARLLYRYNLYAFFIQQTYT